MGDFIPGTREMLEVVRVMAQTDQLVLITTQRSQARGQSRKILDFVGSTIENLDLGTVEMEADQIIGHALEVLERRAINSQTRELVVEIALESLERVGLDLQRGQICPGTDEFFKIGETLIGKELTYMITIEDHLRNLRVDFVVVRTGSVGDQSSHGGVWYSYRLRSTYSGVELSFFLWCPTGLSRSCLSSGLSPLSILARSDDDSSSSFSTNRKPLTSCMP